MSPIIVSLFVVFVIAYFIAIFVKKDIIRYSAIVLSILAVSLLTFTLFKKVGVPTPARSYNNIVFDYPFSPFYDGKIFETYWVGIRNKQILFSVVDITRERKDTLKEVFISDKIIPSRFILLDNQFCPINEEQIKLIQRLNLDIGQIKKLL